MLFGIEFMIWPMKPDAGLQHDLPTIVYRITPYRIGKW